MSDIRSFFSKKKSTSSSNNASSKQKTLSNNNTQSQKRKKKRPQIILDSDSDEDPLPSKIRKSNNTNGVKPSPEKKKKKSYKEESNEDSNEVSIIAATPGKEKHKSKISLSKPKESILKPTTADAFFSNTEQPKVSNKEKKKVNVELKKEVKNKEPEISLDDDDDFDMSAIDETFEEVSPKKNTTPKKKETPDKKEVKPSQSKKLAESKASKEEKSSEVKIKDNIQSYIEKQKVEQQKKVKREEETPSKPPSKQKTNTETPKSQSKSPNTSVKHASTIETPKSQSQNLDTSVDTSSTTPAEKKKSNYWAYKQREGPSNLGAKDIPEGAENCLEGLTFVITGVLESFERDQFVDCIQRHGGKVTSAVSGKTSYLIVGRDPGQSKIDKANKHRTKQLNEDEFLELVKTRPGKHHATTPQPSKPSQVKKTSHESPSTKINIKKENTSIKSKLSPTSTSESQESNSQSSTFSRFSANFSPATQSPSSQKTMSPQPFNSNEGETLLWVDKYKPAALKNIVGQQGDKSNMNKLRKWLIKWRQINQPGAPKPNFYSGKEDGSIFKAALLSGPPGVGKTTTATLVCQELGFSFIEMNASDTRGKKSLETVIKESLSNTTVTGMIQGTKEDACKHVLIMDEVDGMAGNEDRGGVQELIGLIKKTRIPIICMCNDRNHQKIRSLANYCFDLRFYKPRVEQVKAFALSVAAKEGLRVPPQAMEQIVVGANQDIRQVLHNLQMWTATTSTLSYDSAKENASKASKNIKIGPFDVVKQLYTHSEASKMSIHERSDLFFMDYSFIPLFMQENYLMVNPAKGKGNIQQTLDVMSQAADSIADGNLVEKSLRSGQNWSLLPLQGLFSTVLPSMYMSGYMGQRIEFPQWLGKNSSQGKHDRILQELKTHMSLSSSTCMKTDINLDYVAFLRKKLTQPLLNQSLDASVAAKQVIDMLHSYNLTRADWESVIEVGTWGKSDDVLSRIPTKVKSAFTRLFNKDVHKNPYALQQPAKKVKASAADNPDIDDPENEPQEESDSEEDPTKDAMIKMKSEPKKSTTKSKAAKRKPTTAKTTTKKDTKKKVKK